MINNLFVFFPDSMFLSLPSEFGAFLTWMKGAARVAIYTEITFLAIRRLMEIVALEFAVDSNQKLLPKHYDAPGASKIERLFKPAAFSVKANPTPPQKRHQLNMNISPSESQVTCNFTPPSGRGQAWS
jgi:hypothetical protein